MVSSLWPHHRCHCDRRRHLRRRQCGLHRRCRHRSLSSLSSPLLSSPVSVVAAQQWRRSDGQRRWWRSDGDGGAARAMGRRRPRQRQRRSPPLPYDDWAPPVLPSPRSGSRPRCLPPPPVLRRDRRHSRLPPLPSPPSLFDCCVDRPEAGGSNAAIALLPPGMRLAIIFCILLFSMSFVENFATSITSCTVRLGAFRRVFTAISNLASSAALFFDMLGKSVY